MPSVHVLDIKDLKLSDFPQFSCLCELCDCGCFERGKNVHADTCKKRKNKGRISNAIVADPFEAKSQPHTLYADTYVKFDLGANKILNENTTQKITPNSSPSPRRSLKALQENSVLPFGNSAKVSSRTTNHENFKFWRANPASMAQPLQDHASEVMYPTTERNLVTTNDRLMFKSYGSYYPRPPPQNHFEGSFKINQGKMTFDSSYHSDYKSHINIKPKKITKEAFEKRHDEHIPMFAETQTMSDYKYDPKEFRSVWVPKKVSGAKNLFHSHLDPHLHPYSYYDDDTVKGSSYALQFTDKSTFSVDDLTSPVPSVATTTNYQKPYDFTNDKSVRYARSFDNTQVPMLRVLETLPNKFAKIPPIRRSQNTPGSRAESELDDTRSTYQADFQKSGVDMCMSKAYRMLANGKKAQNNNNLSKSLNLISIKE